MDKKPILCLDFDGVLHSYVSGWKGPRNIPDLPMPGALEFLKEVVYHYEVHVFSSRGKYFGGRRAMKRWLRKHLTDMYGDEATNGHVIFSMEDILFRLKFPKKKPPAKITIDDRAVCFTGEFPTIKELEVFKPFRIKENSFETHSSSNDKTR